MTKFRLSAASLYHRPRILVVLILTVLAFLTFWYFRISEKKAPSPSEQYEWRKVQPQKIEQQLGLVGRIRAARQATLSAPFEGTITDMAVQEGETVREGQELVRLDPGQAEIQLRQAQAELLKARQEVKQFRTWSSSPEVSRARRAEQSARAALETTQANLRDTRALFERGIVARMEVDVLIQQAQIQQQDLLTAREERRVIEARGEGEESRIAEMEFMNAQVRYQALKMQSEKQVLKAPFTGLVVRSSTADGGKTEIPRPGERVSQGAALMTIIGLDRIQVLAQVEEADLHLLREGMPVQVSGDGFTGLELAGRIMSIAAQSNAPYAPGVTANYDVVVSIDTPRTASVQTVRLGMSARVVVTLYSNEQRIIVPPEALQTNSGGEVWVIYRATPHARASRIRVEPGRAVSEGIEINGVQAGYIQIPVR
ncbi:HlyD family efflux transporter periplasmic adaptor subunit [Salmonella enterica subsp. enterica serovar Newport]|nr:HlyD family efflux transporter periplasmic adaptor subunit [Salmonella enterica subsp. enterica serovar Newport]